MANEGIMSMPGGMGMQGEEAQQRPAVTSADSYDAAQTALGMVNPGEQAALKEALRQNIGDLQLTPEQLDLLIQVFEYVSQHPGDYKNLVQKMIEGGALDEGDMPEEYDPEFIGAMLAVLQEMRQMQGAGAQEPMDMSPIVEGLQPVGMASGGLADVASYLAAKGRLKKLRCSSAMVARARSTPLLAYLSLRVVLLAALWTLLRAWSKVL